MHIEMPLERFLEMYRLVSLGKLIQGVVHNLNGPLQNLGMDMEMMEYTLGSDKRLPKEVHDGFLVRLQRMEAEFEQISRLIKSASLRIDMEGDYLQMGDLKGLLEEEISFLNASLYFKHNVRKEIHLAEDLTGLNGLSRDLLHALCWFLQAVVEEMEGAEGTAFTLSGRAVPSAVEILLRVEGERAGAGGRAGLQANPAAEGVLKVETTGTELLLALLRLQGVSVACTREAKQDTFTLTIPLSKGQPCP